MATKSTLVTLFLALSFVLISASPLEFAERTSLPISPLFEQSVESPAEPSFDPVPFAPPLTIVRKPPEGDRPELPKQKGTIRTTPLKIKPKIDFLQALKMGAPRFSEPIHKVISASLARHTEWKQPPSGVSRIAEKKPVEPEESLSKAYPPIHPEPGGERGLTKIELLRSKMVKAEVFMLFRLSFSPKGEFAIEMNLDPTAEKGVGVSFPTDTIRLPSETIPMVSQTNASPLF